MQSTVGARAFQNARLQKKLKKQAESLITAAFAAYGDGKRTQTEAICRQILQGLPDHFDALHLLGVCALDTRRFEDAKEALARAITINPRSADVYSDLGTAYFGLNRYEDARSVQEKAISLKPNFPLALTNLGNTLMHMGHPRQALEYHDRAIELKPDYADAHCNRGMVELALGRRAEANVSFDRALFFQPRHPEAIGGKGLVSMELRHYDAAEAAFVTALAAKPNAASILAHRARLHMHLGRNAEATADFDAALALVPTLEVALRGKALLGLLTRNAAQCMAACKKLLEQNPRSEIGLGLLGALYASQGETVAAIEHFDRALAIKPDYEDAIQQKIFVLDFLQEADFAVQQAARKCWWDAIGARMPRCELAPRPLDPERRIVVGYVSSDFRMHSAAFTFMPVLRHHDHRKFEVICYSCSPKQDDVTALFKSFADCWVDAVRLSDDELVDRIQADKVDILVDLSGHSAGNRLAVFARKPAPVQVSAWGHPTGTGLPTIDYVLADPVFIPEEVRHLFAEKVYDLPCMLMIEPVTGLEASSPPMIRNGYVTFGVFNRTDKISDHVLPLWAKLLEEFADARIMIKNSALDDALLRDGLVARFVAHGIAADRVSCIGTTSRGEHLAAFEHVDISLDPFPQNGGVSTWESLYAGVPVVAKLGNAASARSAGAILTAIGLEEYLARDDDSYVAIARALASAPSRLQTLRTEIPARIAASAAGNGEVYARKVEQGYRQFWQEYCASARAEEHCPLPP